MAEDYATVKSLLDDPRLGRSHAEPEKASRYTDAAVLGRPVGSPETEHAEHQAMRRLLTPAFSARRMAKLRSRVQELVDDLLDQMAAAGPPVDLHEMLAFPLPALVICELLGVPYEDRDDFRRWSDDAADMRDRARAEAADAQLKAYASKLLDQKRAEPAEDVLTDLARAQQLMPDVMSDARVVQLAAGLLWAGHETTVSAIDRGVVLLLRNPPQLAAIKADPDLIPSAVEEIMRLPNPVQGPPGRLARWATADIEVGDTVIPSGDLVILSLEQANLTEAMFADARTFDITRKNNAHLGFGHGPHFCIGAPLARTELQTVFSTLFTRFPDLRLAVPFDELRPRNYMLTGGLLELPVTW
ncbi:cytochrome P450 [Flindersiella endophytica]